MLKFQCIGYCIALVFPISEKRNSHIAKIVSIFVPLIVAVKVSNKQARKDSAGFELLEKDLNSVSK